ncbi:LytR/AlgR family response regulator transcription factor [Larkinella bovis]|uniref:LytR/AlgR family response regulator transcription factor n=1 Tax=Larkinella bovis TaxID=683041 RepID=A0ABW0I902_9BACT
MKQFPSYPLKIPLSVKAPDQFLIWVKTQKKLIDTNSIIRIEAQGSYSLIYTRNGERYLVSGNLSRLGARFKGFVRIHRSHLINPAFVNRSAPWLIRESLHFMQLANGESVPVSRRVWRNTKAILTIDL